MFKNANRMTVWKSLDFFSKLFLFLFNNKSIFATRSDKAFQMYYTNFILYIYSVKCINNS